ncbi:MAG: radical SAM protein [Pseudobutyrivibrio sp.]|uniref:radical SAM/SPASM domain-containing protein n=1 Tax=Pseudobutyrivibrio sp. TaxID=2014367 RepID=UPI0025DB88DD|nr:radical SAM protein [Pseudobutyrivibrio sp.]MBQ6462945.1 radical SAM protein [Pseudobutyrivibrio sp.]
MFYRIRKPWRLCGFEDKKYLLDYCDDSGFTCPVSYEAFCLLNKCDGTVNSVITNFSCTEQKQLKEYIEGGIVEELVTPAPLDSWQKYKHFKNRRVLSAMWAITGKCNYHCRHCFAVSEKFSSNKEEFTLEQALYVIQQLSSCGIRNVYLTGGEPLVSPYFYEIVQAILDNELNLERIYTNGRFLTQEVLDMFRELGTCPEIVISFDVLGTHDWMRNSQGAEEATLRAIKTSIKNNFKVCCAVNINRVTYANALDTARFLYNLGVRNIFFIRTSEAPKWVSGDERLSINWNEFFDLSIKITRAMLSEIRNDLTLRFFNTFRITPNLRYKNVNSELNTNVDLSASAWCTKVQNVIFIASDGRVLPCDAFEGASLASNILCTDNNIKKRPLSDILVNSEYSSIMKLSLRDILEHNPDCRNCAYWYMCKGGFCRASGLLNYFEKNKTREIIDDCFAFTSQQCDFFLKGYYENLVNYSSQ